MKREKKDSMRICQEIAEIIERGEMLPWKSHLMISALTGRKGAGVNWKGTPYKGINAFMTMGDLLTHQRKNRQYVTFAQAHQLGGSIKKGASSVPVVYSWRINIWKKDNSIVTDDQMQELILSGEATEKDFTERWTDKEYLVFSIEDTTLEPDPRYALVPEEEEREPREKRIEEAEAIAAGYKDGPKVIIANPALLKRGASGCYIPSLDAIQIPSIDCFDQPEIFYSTLFHEMGHSTGHAKRLNRDMGSDFGSQKYAKEELVAEFTSAILSDKAGIMSEGMKKEDAGYISSWASHIRQMGDRVLSIAISQALQAADWITGKREPKKGAETAA